MRWISIKCEPRRGWRAGDSHCSKGAGNVLRAFSVLSILCILCGCSKSGLPVDGECAQVSLRIEAADPLPDSTSGFSGKEAVKSDPLTPWDKAVDGQGIYSAAAYLFSGSSLVAHKEVELAEPAAAADISFGEDIPYGSYSLYIVANASPYGEYAGLQGWESAAGNVVSQRKMLDEFSLFAISSQGGVCKVVPHPLTSVMELELVPGENRVEASLSRSVARVRIAVENNSGEVLEISELSFSNKFAQQSAWLFPNKGFRGDLRCGISVSGKDAIVPFAGTYVNPVKVGAMGSTVLFDAYILESASQAGESGYSYTLRLGYDTSSGYFEKSVQIPLQTVDASTGQPEDVTEINRNDFIDVVVRVSYNKNSGSIVLEALPWKSGGGSVDFS